MFVEKTKRLIYYSSDSNWDRHKWFLFFLLVPTAFLILALVLRSRRRKLVPANAQYYQAQQPQPNYQANTYQTNGFQQSNFDANGYQQSYQQNYQQYPQGAQQNGSSAEYTQHGYTSQDNAPYYAPPPEPPKAAY